MENILEVENLKMYYHTSKGLVKAINDISFKIKKGETLGIVGESGCGKTSLGTSLLRMPSIPGKYEGGKIILDNEDIIPLKEEYIRKNIRWAKISMVFQGAMNSLTPVYTIEKQMIETINRHIDMNKSDAVKLIEEYLGYVGLHADVAKRYPHELSGGMKKRVSLARAIAFEPEILLYDEPSSGLDPVTSAKIDDLIVQMQKLLGVTSIVVTHDMKSAFYIADRIAMLYNGEMIAIGTPEEIKKSTDSRVVEFINVSKERKR